jgi:hypothetical protein
MICVTPGLQRPRKRSLAMRDAHSAWSACKIARCPAREGTSSIVPRLYLMTRMLMELAKKK